jgi:hypothetical protein
MSTSSPTPSITSLAGLVRHLQPGLEFRCEHHVRPQVSGIRKVVKAGPSVLRYEFVDPKFGETKVGRMEYGRASEIRFAGNRVTFLKHGAPCFTYVFGV